MHNDSVRFRSRNKAAALFLTQGIFFFIGYCFFDATTILPLFVETVTGRVEWAGIATTIHKASTLLLQLLLGTAIFRVKNVPRYLGIILMIGYTMPLVMLIPLGMGLGGTALAMCVFLCTGIFWGSDGLMVVGYYDLMGRLFDSRRRGRILGFQQFIGGAGAVLGAFAVKGILDYPLWDTYRKYMVIFGTGGVILFFSALSLFFVKDKGPMGSKEPFRIRTQYRHMADCFMHNKRFRKLIYCQLFFLAAMASAPYLLIFSKQYLAFPEMTVSTLLNVQILGTLLGGAMFALLSPRWGSRAVLLLYCVLCMVSAAMGLFSFLSIGHILTNSVLMVAVSGMANASWAGFMNAAIDVSEESRRPYYMVLLSALSFPLSFAGAIAGQIIVRFGYEALFVLCLLCGGAALFFAIALWKGQDCVKKS